MRGKAFTECWVSGTSNGLEARNEVYIAIAGNIKGEPSELGRREVDPWINGQEVTFNVFVIR
jgi:hypothetical protein